MARSVLVTGASSGIGLASALRLAGAGWRVLGGVRSEKDAERLREQGVEPLELDVTDAALIAAAAETVGAELHGLVDNAGIAIVAPLELVPRHDRRRATSSGEMRTFVRGSSDCRRGCETAFSRRR